MKARKYEGGEERRILTALVVSDEVLGRVHQRFGNNGARPFRSKWSNIVAKWCLEYYAKYQKAPRAAVRSIFEDFVKRSSDGEAVELMESFLDGLSKDHVRAAEELNEEHLIDVASHHFETVRIEKLCEEAQGAIEGGDLKGAREALASYEKIDFSSSAWIDLFSDEMIRRVAHQGDEDQMLLRFRGDLDRFLSPYLGRTRLICFMGPEKRGKSFWLQEMVWQALKQRRRVLYYVLGDLSDVQVAQRLYSRALRRPWVCRDEKGLITSEKEMEIKWPMLLRPNGREVAYEYELRLRRRIKGDLKSVRQAREELQEKTACDKLRLQFRMAGADVVTAGEIEQEVRQRAVSDWVPDVVVVDYADLLLAEPHVRSKDKREQIDATWKILKRIALDYHCLVVIATQAARSSYKKQWVMDMGDFSEDKRKNAHVDGMIGINQTDTGDEDGDKDRGIYRLNWINNRMGAGARIIWTAGCLDIACPCIVSSLGRKKKKPDPEND